MWNVRPGGDRRSGCNGFELTGPIQSSVVACSVSLRGARRTEDAVVFSPRQHVARHVKNLRRIESAQRRFGVRTWWSSASSGGDGRPTATKVQRLFLAPHPLTPSPRSSPHPSLTPPLPSSPLPSPPPLLPPPRLTVEERGKGQRNFLFKPINARACGWSCSAVVCSRILRPSHTPRRTMAWKRLSSL